MCKIHFLVLSFAFFFAFAKPGPGCKNPQGSNGQTRTEGCLEYTCKGKTWKKTGDTCVGPSEAGTDCPSSLMIDGESQKYRYVEDVLSLEPTQYFPCTGDIPNCIYTAHRKFYCVNGVKPDYSLQELQPHYDSVAYQNVSTQAGEFINLPGTQSFQAADGVQPFLSLDLFPNAFANRLVWGGFSLTTTTNKYDVGLTSPISGYPNIKPTKISLGLGEGITEAFGKFGFLIDQVTFGVTLNPANSNGTAAFYSVGGFQGGNFDATPPPSVNGPCELVALSGDIFDNFDNFYKIQAIRFLWSCVGKPTHYVY